MKKISIAIFVGYLLHCSLQAQSIGLPAPVDTNTDATVVAPTIIERSANERIWGLVSSVTNGSGQVVAVTNPAYTELGSGLCKFSPESNTWVDADPTIIVGATNAYAIGTRHTVTFNGDVTARSGAVIVTGPDGSKFAVGVYGLAYYDAASGSNVLLGAVQSAQGTVIGANEVVYSNAFGGAVTADVEYFNRLSGVEQNVVLRTALPPPESFLGSGLSNTTCWLEIWTEFQASPEPRMTAVRKAGEEDDALLDFGEMRIPVGTAFAVPQPQGTKGLAVGMQVRKSWQSIGGRTFLIEAIPYDTIVNEVGNLPPHASLISPNSRRDRMQATILPLLPRTNNPVEVAPLRAVASIAGQEKPGYAIDYSLVTGYLTNYTFYNNRTYYVSSMTYFYGTNILEGGTVIKGTNTIALYLIDPSNSLVFAGSTYLPTIFTDMNDNSVGARITGSTGTPIRECWFIWSLATSVNASVSYARFSHANYDYASSYAQGVTVRHCQFVDGLCALDLASLSQLQVQNVLFSTIENCICADFTSTFSGENITADSCGYFVTSLEPSVGSFTNSIFTDVGWIADNVSVTNVDSVITNSAGIYQSVGSGSYYLAANSPYRGQGTVNIDPQTLADLQSLTTYPPVPITTNFTGNTTLNRTAQRDNSGAALDLGYHYPPLDYVLHNLTVNANVTLTLGNGVAVGINGTYGLNVNGNLTSQGTPFAMNLLAPAQVAQEGQGTNLFMLIYGNGTWQSLTFRFTQLPVLAGVGTYFSVSDGPPITAGPLMMMDCQLSGGSFSVGLDSYLAGSFMSLNCVNNVFDGANLAFTQSDGEYLPLNLGNNLFDDSTIQLNVWNSVNLPLFGWSIHNNLFAYSSPQLLAGNPWASANLQYFITDDHNGYVGSSNLPYSGGGDVTPSMTDFQVGALGPYYYPTNGSNLAGLLQAGDCVAANAGANRADSGMPSEPGLYHYTVTTNNTVEGANTVGIGFHYIALGANGQPLNATGDGLPDYIADSNGDGVYDAGDLVNWLNPFTIFDQGVSYGGYCPANVRLGYWRFNNASNLTNEAGVPPMATNYLVSVSNWSGLAVSLTNGYSELEYPVTSNGRNYLDPAIGSVRFWYQPNWSATVTSNSPNWVYFLAAESSAGAMVLYDQYSGFNFSLDVSSNQYGTSQYGFDQSGNNGLIIDYQSNLWYQIVFSYSPSNTALYCDGTLIGTGMFCNGYADGSGYEVTYDAGCGNVFYPAVSTLTGFFLGNQPSFNAAAKGQFDELETFNYPLTAEAVAAGYPYFGGNPTNTLDSHYVGRSDMLQSYVDGTWGTTNSVVPSRLGYWRFDSPLLYSEQGSIPTSQSGATLTPSWSGMAASIGGSGSHLTYPDVNSSGWANINCQQGSLRFWFKPNTSSTVGPFVYMGNSSGSQQWALWLTNSGSTINFVTESNDTPTSLPASCSFSTTNWAQIVLTYGPTNACLYLNGTLSASNMTGPFTNWPSASNRKLGMVIGNTTAYNSPINGQFEEMETFNYQLSAGEISSNFLTVQSVDTDLDGIPDLLEDIQLGSSRPFLGSPVVITGTIEAEQFDLGGPNVAYHTSSTHPASSYRPTGMSVSPVTNDLGLGYCLDQTQAGDWAQYTLNILAPQMYVVEVRANASGTNTGGVFQCEFTNAAATWGTNTGPLTITSANWTNYSTNVYLTNGITLMKLHCLTNSGTTNYVGKFNYISIYPNLPTPTIGSGSTNVILALSTNNDFPTASSNANAIQTAVNGLTSGGVVQLQPGTYFVAQTTPNELLDASANAAVSIVGNNIEIAGTVTNGAISTTLIAYNRATTIFSFGENQFVQPQCSNFILRDMTLEAQPHRAVTNLSGSPSNLTNTIYTPAQLYPSGQYMTGSLVALYGVGSGFNYNILASNCGFLYADRSIELEGTISNVMVRDCNFTAWGGLDSWGDTNTYYTYASTAYGALASIWDRAISYNLVVMENGYNGNTQITSVNTNWTNGCRMAPDGFVWAQGSAENNFIARNSISNYWLEAVQINAGPSSLVGNTYYSYISAPSACALCFGAYTFVNPGQLSACFIGNSVQGGRNGVEDTTYNGDYSLYYAHTYNCSGNQFNLYPPFVEIYAGNGPLDGSSDVADADGGCSPNVCGNTVVAGGYGVEYAGYNGKAIILNNDFSSITNRGIGTSCAGDSMQGAQIYGNEIGEGVSFHVQVGITNGFGWFLDRNQYLNAGSNAIPVFLDPISAPLHLSSN